MQETINRIKSAVEYILNTDQDATITLNKCHLDWHSVEIDMDDPPVIGGDDEGVFGVSVLSHSDILNEKATEQLIAELEKQLPEYIWH